MMRRDEFEESSNDPLTFWLSKLNDEICCLIDAKVGDMVGFDQRNPHHCYDIFTHSLKTIIEIKDTVTILLRVAVFFHDIRKPVAAREKKVG